MRNDRKISKKLQSMADYIDERLKEITGTDIYSFSLVIFNPIGGERMNYISTHKRSEVIKVWKTLIDAWENKNMPDVPTHKIQ